jgi:hypothetical protein
MAITFIDFFATIKFPIFKKDNEDRENDVYKARETINT